MSMTKTNTIREPFQRVIQETCDLWDIWSQWWGDMSWPTTIQWQRQIQREIKWSHRLSHALWQWVNKCCNAPRAKQKSMEQSSHCLHLFDFSFRLFLLRKVPVENKAIDLQISPSWPHLVSHNWKVSFPFKENIIFKIVVKVLHALRLRTQFFVNFHVCKKYFFLNLSCWRW